MSSIARRLIPAALIGCIVVIGSVHVAGQQRATVTVTRLYSDPDGQAHAGKIEVKLMPSGTYSQTDESDSFQASGAHFLRLPRGKVLDWHNPARRQYAVTLSGRGEVELAGGQKILLNPGQIVLAEDVTGKGHITRSTGSEDLVFLVVPFAAQ